jgi:hypothetical protein
MANHDFVQIVKGSKQVLIYNCQISIETNTGIRVDNGTDVEIRNNEITGVRGTGWCMLEIENIVINCNVHHNIFYDYKGSSGSNVTQPVHCQATNLVVHDNVLWNVGIVAIGVDVNNIKDPADHSIANWNAKGYGVQK